MSSDGDACARCGAARPAGARFCPRCGTSTRRNARHRRDSYAVQPGEHVVQLAVVSTVMPHANAQTGNRYRWALAVSMLAVLVFTFAGLLSAAILSAALVVPVVYLLYLYDLGVWGDAPLRVVGALVVVTGVLGAVVSLAFDQWVFGSQHTRLDHATVSRAGIGALPVGPFLVFAVLLPVVAEIVMNIGPVWLAVRPAFDDVIDCLTFGVAAGAAYAAAETIVVYRSIFFGDLRTTQGIVNWIPVILNLMIVKSLVYGAATGIAIAAFSGRSEGYSGFSARYLANLALAIAALIAYWAGTWLFTYADAGQWFALAWGVVVLVALFVRVRAMLHTALLEAAAENAASGVRAAATVTDGGVCPECEMALLPEALFCIVCGQSVRATSALARRSLRAPAAGGAT